MKKVVLSVTSAILILAAAPQILSATSPPASLQQETKQETKILSGTIIKSGNNFILSDPANKLSYLLDDAEKARQYEGKKVKVTGTVDVASNTIHVESIQEIA